MILEEITPLILTYNEEVNIQQTLDRLNWAKNIIIIDSYSTDKTLQIVKFYSQVKVFQRTFDTHANQWNYGLEKVTSEWVLSLDADYVVSDELIAEIKELPTDLSVDAYFVKFQYCVFGKPLRGTILPPRQVLFKTDQSIYIDDGHIQLLQVKGQSGLLSSYIYHDDRKPFSRWLWAQDRYMILEAKKLRESPLNQLSLSDRIRRQKIIAPFLILIYCLIIKGGIFDGWQAWNYAFQRMLAEIILSIRLIEHEIKQA